MESATRSPQGPAASRKSSECEPSKTLRNRAGAFRIYRTFLTSQGGAAIGRERGGDFSNKTINVFGRWISSSNRAFDVWCKKSPMEAIGLLILVGSGPPVESTSAPPGAV